MKEGSQRATRILLVDDDPVFRDALAFSLKRKGYDLLLASGGKEAFELLRAHPVDIVVSDIRMPEGDGVELLGSIRERDPDVPVILMVTGFGDMTTDDAHQKGADALLSKPLEPGALEGALRRLASRVGEAPSRSEKLGVGLSVELRFQDLRHSVPAKIVDLGSSSMFVAFQDPHLNVSDPVMFRIALEGAEPALAGSGVVRWVRVKDTSAFPSGCGIEFTYLGQNERRQVLDLSSAGKS
jgi:CheY-like chemotaxis protein